MDETKEAGRPEPRTLASIFGDLRKLAQSNGALHEISSLVFRDHVVTVDRHDGRVVDDPEHRWSTSKLNKNELLLLLGLMVQSTTDRTYSVQRTREGFAFLADSFLRELHDRVIVDSVSKFDPTSHRFAESEDAIGLFAREAIYYGAEALYLHQLVHFARIRYMKDNEWLVQNIGISIDSMLDIARLLEPGSDCQMSQVHAARGIPSQSRWISRSKRLMRRFRGLGDIADSSMACDSAGRRTRTKTR